MLDIHTHVLPGMDDGSRSVEESLAMLGRLAEQGVDRVALTSHFYAEDETPESFLSRRARAYEALVSGISDKNALPELFLGAEVCYYIGVSRTEGIERLCIEGTPLLMLEMPKTRWDRGMTDEALSLATDGRVILLLAHIDRYFEYNRLDVFEMLAAHGALMQINASFAADRRNRRMLRALSRRNLIQFIGTDCHGMDYRRPDITPAIDAIVRYTGETGAGLLDYYEEEFFD